ncbi:hypothetical protein TNCV_2370211 [Trichonephila clavipes]|nr:hypothetical protein TNCV_2370211 [Trichonephila clavipes]
MSGFCLVPGNGARVAHYFTAPSHFDLTDENGIVRMPRDGEIREREPATSFRHKRQDLLFSPLGFSSCRGAEGALKPLDHRRESGFHSPHVTRTPVGMFQKMVFFCTRTLQEM